MSGGRDRDFDIWGFEVVDSVPRLGRSKPPALNPRADEIIKTASGEGFGFIFPERSEDEVQGVFQYPPADCFEREILSLQHHAQYYQRSCGLQPPSSHIVERVLYEMEKAYQLCVWSLPDDFLSFESYCRCLRKLDRTSSPGYPYMMEATTIGDWLGWDGVWYDSMKIQRLWYDVTQVLEKNYDSIYRLFIKCEPHKKEKVLENRWRLIIASPLCIQVAWHMLFSFQNDLEIKHSYYIPSQQGFVPVNGGWKLYLESWKQKGYDTGLDKKAWDWNVPKWLLDWDLEFRYRMGRGKGMQKWGEIAKWLYEDCFGNPSIVLSSGLVIRQIYPGIMKSGCVNTISTNSHMQIMVHIAACLEDGVNIQPLPVACGDDTLQCLSQATNLETYARYGAIVKSASAGLEFVGHEFLDVGPQPLYFEKHLEKFKHVPPDVMEEYLDSMARMYCHCPILFDFWVYAAYKLGLDSALMSRQAYLYWYDYCD